MLRMASACRSDSENSAISTGFGSSSVRMICDHPVEVEEGDQEAVEQLEPVVDLADPHLRLADEDLDLELEPGRQAPP